jgi:hypothetical protein
MFEVVMLMDFLKDVEGKKGRADGPIPSHLGSLRRYM